MIRDCNYDDIPWLVEAGIASYAGLLEDMDREAGALWFKACLESPNTIVMRGDTHAICAYVQVCPWAPKHKVADLIYLFGRKRWTLEPLQLVEAVSKKCEELGCDRLIIGSVFEDLSPIARRLGGVKLNPLWAVEYRK